jgi:class 3 adenylate cyclase
MPRKAVIDRGQRNGDRRSGRQRKLAAFIFADVVGYSRMVAEDETRTLAAVRQLRHEIIEPLIAAHAGRPFAALGDGFVADFRSAVDATVCAVAIQRGLARQRGRVGQDLWLRIGINIGDVFVDSNGDLLGDPVNVTARLQALAEPGGIAISGKTFEELRGRLRYPFVSAGESSLKNIPWPVPVYALSAAAISELPDGEAEPAGPAMARRRHTAMVSAIGVFVAALLAGAAAWWLITPGPPPKVAATTLERPAVPPEPAEPLPVTGRPVIAVLPITNMSREPRWDRLWSHRSRLAVPVAAC